MDILYSLTWDAADPNTDMYGAQINYSADGVVEYQNELQPAGKKIHWWSTKLPEDTPQSIGYGSKLLPQIPRHERYHLMLDAEIEPAKSVGLLVASYDAQGQLDKEKMELDQELDFELGENAHDYEIALEKFNNEKVTFRRMYVIPTSLWDEMTIEPRADVPAVDLLPRQDRGDPSGTGNLMIRTEKRVVDSAPLDAELLHDPLRIVRVPSRWSALQLADVLQEFKDRYNLKNVNCWADDDTTQKLMSEAQALMLKRKKGIL
ncbi:accessory Sec system protein Asp3 [Fructilactobacillus carniphilus]|uniref:Accessory Sec system protein Asp3 n=1 Tax=Fructilactobacillus carniphilus TaxID=2940297 RepID=A0ABY5BU43_9LACO|nr:accessory Sec system protein Asp3 [Fructilactobacillus carniphilus]USS90019.1 accessory Sec system protein Asp3 [Fructilactobacillus carniphilus]